MTWTFALADARTGADLGDLVEVTQRSIRFPLNRVPTCTFTVRRDNPQLLNLLAADLTLVKVYEDYTATALPSGQTVPTLRFCGPITSVQKASSTDNANTLAVTASGPAWRLGFRLLGKSKTGVKYGDPAIPTLLDRGTIAWTMITDARTDFLGGDNDHGIRQGTITASSSTAVGPLYFAKALDEVSAMSAALDGFDWEIAPVEPVLDSQGLKLGVFNAGPIIGSANPNALFEYGAETRRSAKGFGHQILPAGLCNWAFNLPPGFPDNATQDIVSYADPTGTIATRGLYEDVIQTDVTVDALRTKLIQEHVQVRRFPRQIIQFTPTVDDLAYPGRVPKLFTDYIVGDIVPFRAIEEGLTTVDANFRVFAVGLDIDQAGSAIPTLAFVQADA